ncbi:MAG: hypothetical protein VCA36_09965, partial [Opitutales bacterium]
GLNFAPTPQDYAINGNLHWGLVEGPKFEGDFFKAQGRKMAFRKVPWPVGWMKSDLFADPRFKRLTAESGDAYDLTLKKGSPAQDAGVEIPDEWFDPLRQQDAKAPDLGAMPAGVGPWRVGVRGRLDVFGAEN